MICVSPVPTGCVPVSKDQQVTRTRQQNTRQQNTPPTRTQSEQRRNGEIQPVGTGDTPITDMLGRWVNPHREQQTIPQGQTSKPAQIFPHANGQSAPGKAALATFAGAPGATHRARPRSPSRVKG